LGNTLHYNKKQQPGPETWDLFILKLSPAGNVLYSQTYGSDGEDYAGDLDVDPSGNVLITGGIAKTVSFGAFTLFTNQSIFNFDIFLLKLDQAGAVIWARSYGKAQTEYARKISCDTKSNIVLSGIFSTSLVAGAFTITTTYANDYFDTFLIKLDPSGNPVWAKSIAGTSIEDITDLVTDALDNVIVAGRFEGNMSVGSFTCFNSDQYSSFLLKYDKSGNLQWPSFFNSAGVNILNSVVCDKGNNIYLTGRFTNDSLIMNGAPIFTTNDSVGGIVVKLLANGAPDWIKVIDGQDDRDGRSLTVSPSGDLFFGGQAKKEWYFDADTLAEVKWFTSFARMHVHTYTPPNTAEIDENIGVNNFSVYPNPATSFIHVQCDKAAMLGEIKIFDLRGQLVKEGKPAGTGDLYVGDMPPGVYFLWLKSDDRNICRKMLIQ
jgi:hypothetical protein